MEDSSGADHMSEKILIFAINVCKKRSARYPCVLRSAEGRG